MESVFKNLQDILAEWWQGFLTMIPQIIAGLVVLVISLYLARLLASLLNRGLNRRKKSDPELNLLLTRIVRWTVIIFGILLAFQQAGVEITAFLAGLGIAGFTIGFALQDVSKNFIAGILLLLQQPFELGDAIQVGDYAGTVTEINLRDTVIRTFDGRPVSIPNGDVFTSAIVNFSRTNSRRIELDVGVAYGTDLKQAKELVLETLAEQPGVMDDPAPMVVYHTFGSASIDMTIYYWLDLNEIGYLDGQSDGLMAINTAFEQAGIEIPFPIQTLLIQNQPKTDAT